jgi:hypothetical protein
MKKFFLLFITLLLWAGFNGEVWGQTNNTTPVLLDNYDGTGDLTYVENTDAQWSISGGIYVAGTNAVTTPEHSSAAYDLTNSIPTWNLSKSYKNVWIGHFKILRATSGWGNSNYGCGAVLASNNSDLSSTSAQGYALVIENGTTDKVTLIKFSQGIKDGATNLPANSTSIVSVAVDPGTTGFNYLVELLDDGKWKISYITGNALSDANAVNKSSYSGGNATSSNADSTYTGSDYKYAGWVFSHSTGNTATDKANFDNFGAAQSALTSSSSDIIANSSFTYPTNIAYGTYQGTAPLTTVNSIEVAQFDIRDGGASADADALSTTLTAIGFNVTGHANLRRIALFDGTTNVGEVAAGATASFSSLSLEAADGGSKTFSVRVSFLSNVTDNQNFSFTVNSAAAAGAGSGFAAANAGGAATSTTGDNNKIEVTATDIIFNQQVSTVSMGAVMSPSPTLKAVDANANLDLDYSSAWSVAVTTGSVTFDGGATTSGNFSSGVATLSNLVFDKAGEDNKITVTSGGFSDESAQFNVTDPQPEINIKVVDANYLTNSTYAFGNQLSGTSTSAVTFTIENLGTKELNLSGSPLVEISGTNSSEFTVDISSTDATIPASETTTFTVTFSPTSQGSKTAQLSIANDDGTGDENPYIINLTGTGTVSGSSDISSTGGFSYTSNIAYASFQSASTLTTENSVGVNGLTLRDGGSSADDTDNLGTTLTAISFTTGGSTAIRTAALFDGTTNVSEVAVNGETTITFTGLTLSASDNSTKNFVLRVTFQPTVTDNQQITFTVSSATASSAGSGFAAGNAGAAASSTTGDINRIEVTATQLAFVQQPSNTIVNSNMTPAVTVKGTDVNTNTDLDFTADINITSTGTLSSSPQTAAAVAGIATFSSINHTAAGTSLTLSSTSTGLTGATSSTFDITIQPAGILLFEENFNFSGVLTSNGWSVHSSGTNPLTTTTNLTYSNYASNIGNAAAIGNAGGEDLNRALSDELNTNGASIYCSFLVTVTDNNASKTGDYFLHLGDRVDATTFTLFSARVFARIVSSNVNFGISNTSTATYGSTNFSKNTTYLLIVKYTINTGGNDEVKLWVLPSEIPSSESATGTPEVTNTSTSGTDIIDAIALRQGSSSNSVSITVDGIRVATNWGSLVGNPQYNSATNLGAGNYNDLNVLSGGVVTLTGSANINGTLNLNGGTIDVGNNVLTVNSISGGSASSYIKTTGSGGLKRNVPTIESGTLFPVGTESSYNPVTITNSGTADNFTVSVKETFDNAPVDPTKVVNRQWSISEDTPGGSNAAVKLQWNTAEEAGSFIRTNAIYVGHYTGGTWQQTAATYVDLGSGVYTAEASGFTSFSPFSIGNENALPVELSSFNAAATNGAVKLTWQTATEVNNYGFDVERTSVRLSDWEKIGFVAGNGNSNAPKDYSYTDNSLDNSGKYSYRLKQIDNDGAVTYSNEIEIDVTVVLEYALSQNYPNPFNPSTVINYTLSQPGFVTIKIYNTLGQEVSTLLNGQMDAGKHTLTFDASKLSSGMYLYKITAGNFTQVKKMLLAK